ncbi:hypothetical protein DFP72DRAFT_990568 [Ephemerocybe angulata]|uniref:GST N-terminal domain-containing protein n=1 Tax=Ephemerocybe angulata TaxID=980116 RepID=A0A8H6HWX8_9AGAR|nr:hypothetical protein DFP72DRAFT_990568 [Tulosesus angulatus]
MPERITLYASQICPYAHRVDITLKESGLEYKRFEIDLFAKPDWYASKINLASKVPAIAYGGPDVEPDSPSPESIKLAESYILQEFIADLVPKLLPSDPVARHKARFFVDTFSTKYTGPWAGALLRGEDPIAALLPAIEALQNLLPAEGYAVGEWSIADAAVTPHLARTMLVLKYDLGAYDEEPGKRLYEILTKDEKFARFRKYFDNVTSREAFKSTWDEEPMRKGFYNHLKNHRSDRLAKFKGSAAAST